MKSHSPLAVHRGVTAALLLFALAACAQDPTGVDSEDPCTPGEIALGSSVNGSLGDDGCRRGGYPVARWAFDLSQEMDVRIDLTSSDMDPYLELHTSGGALIAANDDFGSLNSAIITHLAPGRYVIQARDLGGRVGSYRLSVREGPDCSPVGDLVLDQTETGTLDGDDCLWEWGGNSDNWSLSLSERTNLRITAKSPDFDEVVLIRDADGYIMNGADESGPTGFAQLDMTVPAGEWTITVGALTPGRSGAYELTVGPTPPCTPGTALTLGESETGSITAEDCLFDGYTPADSFALVLERETPLDFHLKSSDIRPTLIVRDANGFDVTYADDMSGIGSARTQVTLEAGSYAVYALTFDYPQTGSYQLTVSEIACKDPIPIAFGSSGTGTLGDDDCLRANGAWQESWSLDLAADESVRIDMTSEDVDAYLILEDDQGQMVAVDDDGGDGVDARIEVDLTAGSYRIVASSFGGGQAGSYTLTVGAPPAPAAVSPDASATSPAAPAVASPEDVSLKRATAGGDDGWRERLRDLRARLTPEWLIRRK